MRTIKQIREERKQRQRIREMLGDVRNQLY